MGNNNCSGLNRYEDVCQISPCIETVNGLSADSVSPTDTWILIFKSGAKYEGTPISRAFLKYYIDPSSLTKGDPDIKGRLSHITIDEYLIVLQSLNYEVLVYKDIIRPLLDYRICPNFVKYLASGQGCTQDNLLKMLVGKAYVKGTNTRMTRNQAEVSILRSLLYMRLTVADRPSINKVQTVVLPNDSTSNYKVNFLINEAVPNNTPNFYNWFSRIRKLTNGAWKVITQVMCGCYAMSLSKMVHNDLHVGNIWVVNEKNRFVYVLDNNNVVDLDTQSTVLLYDFDRSYVQRLGPNIFLTDEEICDKKSECNQFIPNKDFIKFLCSVHMMLNDTKDKEIILDLFIPKGNNKLRNFFKTEGFEGCFLNDKNLKALTEETYLQLLSAQQILLNSAEKAGLLKTSIPTGVSSDNIFYMKKDMFNNDGSLKQECKLVAPIPKVIRPDFVAPQIQLPPPPKRQALPRSVSRPIPPRPKALPKLPSRPKVTQRCRRIEKCKTNRTYNAENVRSVAKACGIDILKNPRGKAIKSRAVLCDEIDRVA